MDTIYVNSAYRIDCGQAGIREKGRDNYQKKDSVKGTPTQFEKFTQNNGEFTVL